MRKKGQEAMEFLMTYGWAILAAIMVVGVLLFIIIPPAIPPEFHIYKEECHNETIETNYYSLDPDDYFSLDYLGISDEEVIKEIVVLPDYFEGYYYVRDNVCYYLLNKEGIYADHMDLTIQIGNEGIFNIDPYVSEMSISEFDCKYSIYRKEGEYTFEDKGSKTYNNIIIPIPDPNISNVKLENYHDWGLEIQNKDHYWNYEFKIRLKDKQVCEKVEVDEIEMKKEDKSCIISLRDKKDLNHTIGYRTSNPNVDYCIKDFNPNLWEVDEYYVNENFIKIKDLTIEWLEENCERKCIRGFSICKLEKGDVLGEDRDHNCIDCLNTEYKCGDYYVEVN